jgi:anthranilate synthase/aminodeoxychorismate synthase-like glutamine amidotransferase
VVVIDNYDSFTYNLVQYVAKLGNWFKVYRNDVISVAEVVQEHPKAIIISPGPCTPNEAGISVDLIKEAGSFIPILGVCLGHQCIGQAYGGKVVRAKQVMHGKVSDIYHNEDPIFEGIPSPFVATRYHSLVVEPNSLPSSLAVTAWTADNVIMGLKHIEYPVYGVQFHPESVLTTWGERLIFNFLKLSEKVGHMI